MVRGTRRCSTLSYRSPVDGRRKTARFPWRTRTCFRAVLILGKLGETHSSSLVAFSEVSRTPTWSWKRTTKPKRRGVTCGKAPTSYPRLQFPTIEGTSNRALVSSRFRYEFLLILWPGHPHGHIGTFRSEAELTDRNPETRVSQESDQ